MRIIIDTRVLVVASRSRSGASFQLVPARPNARNEIALTVALYTEWQSVPTRSAHLPPGATVETARGFVRYLASIAHLQDVHYLWRPFLRDANDEMVLECAVASGSAYIVTHKTKSFRLIERLNVQAVSPAELLNLQRITPLPRLPFASLSQHITK